MSKSSDDEFGTPRDTLVSRDEEETKSHDDFKSIGDRNVQRSFSLSDFGLKDEELYPWEPQNEMEEQKTTPLKLAGLENLESGSVKELKKASKGVTLRNLFRKTEKSQAGEAVFLLLRGNRIPENFIRANIISKNQSTQGYSLQDINGKKYEEVSKSRILNVSEFIELLKQYPEDSIDNVFGTKYLDVNLNDIHNFETIRDYLYKPITPFLARGKTRKLFSRVLPIESESAPRRELIVYIMREIAADTRQQRSKAGEQDSRFNTWDRGQLLSIEKIIANGIDILKYNIKLDKDPKPKLFYFFVGSGYSDKLGQYAFGESGQMYRPSQIITEKQYYEFVMRTASRDAEIERENVQTEDAMRAAEANSNVKIAAPRTVIKEMGNVEYKDDGSNAMYEIDYGEEGGKRRRTRRRKSRRKKQKTQKMRAISRKGKKRARKDKSIKSKNK